jgi:hypothetical protein
MLVRVELIFITRMRTAGAWPSGIAARRQYKSSTARRPRERPTNARGSRYYQCYPFVRALVSAMTLRARHSRRTSIAQPFDHVSPLLSYNPEMASGSGQTLGQPTGDSPRIAAFFCMQGCNARRLGRLQPAWELVDEAPFSVAGPEPCGGACMRSRLMRSL